MNRFASLLVIPSLLFLTACDSSEAKNGAAPAPAEASPATDANAPKTDSEAQEKESEQPQAKAEAPKADGEGQHYGAALSGAPLLKISDLLADPKKYEGQLVRVEGMVTGVCTKRGCWFDLAGDKPGEKVKFKVKDGTMVFPPDSKGKQAVAEGEVIVRELTLEQSQAQAKHMAEDAGKEFDPASVTEPMTIVMLDGKGATISVQS